MLSTRTLFSELIDYAGLFPPANLSMAAAAGNYARYLREPNSWMLGRFIVPAERLDEFAEAAAPLLTGEAPWRLSVLCTPPLSTGLKHIEDLHRRGLGVKVDAVEMKVAGPDDVEAAMPALPKEFAAYFEIPMESEPDRFVRAIARTGARAKMRTGGLTASSIPDSHSVARFLLTCAARDVAFKATAGLHHPLRGRHKLAPGPESPTATMHGFMNVFLAAAFVRMGVGFDEIVKLLNEESSSAFQIEAECIGWEKHGVTPWQIGRARQSFAISFGSCSFEEPVEDLQAISLL